MGTGRLEAFSDGVIAIIITIMVLEMKVPRQDDWAALIPVLPVFLSYVLSYIYVGIYWNNHHHLIQSAGKVSAGVLWANLHLLFWLSLFPFATGWIGESPHATAPTIGYGVILLMAAIAYYLLQQAILNTDGEHALLRRALGKDWKGKLSPVAYLAGIVLAMWQPAAAQAVYVGVAMLWLIPDRRIEGVLGQDPGGSGTAE